MRTNRWSQTPKPSCLTNHLETRLEHLEDRRNQLREKLQGALQQLTPLAASMRSLTELSMEKEKLQQELESSLAARDQINRDIKQAQDGLNRVALEQAEFFQKIAPCDSASIMSMLELHEAQAVIHEIMLENVTRRNFNLSNLYVTTFRLYETMDRADVLDAFREIVANLIGSEELMVFEFDQEKALLVNVLSHGVDPGPLAVVPLGQGLIGQTALAGSTWLAGWETPEPELSAEAGLTACIPLIVGNCVIGVIAIFQLLPQKSKFCDFDRELFTLLSSHGATALYCTSLHAKSSALPAQTHSGLQ